MAASHPASAACCPRVAAPLSPTAHRFNARPARPACRSSQLEGWDFTRLFYSPLKRAAQTADIVWGGRPGATSQLACLREIDLYSFQVGWGDTI